MCISIIIVSINSDMLKTRVRGGFLTLAPDLQLLISLPLPLNHPPPMIQMDAPVGVIGISEWTNDCESVPTPAVCGISS